MAPDGSVFASGSLDNTLRFWDGSAGNEVGEPIVTLSTGRQGASCWGLAFSPNSRQVATTAFNHPVQIWDIVTRALVTKPLHIPSGGGFTVAFSHDGSRIAADAGGGSVGIWDSVSGEAIFNSLEGHTNDVRWTAFTPDVKQLVTASLDATICRWDMQSGARIGKPLTGHSESISGGVISRDGNTLATASDDRTVRFWDLKTGNQKSRFLQHERGIRSVALSRDGSLLATADWGGKVYIWDMKAIEAEFDEEAHDEAEASNHQNRPEITQEQGSAEHGQEQVPPEVTREEDRRSETSSTRRRLDMLAVGFSASGTAAEVSYYDREGGFWEEFSRAGPSGTTREEEEKADNPSEDKPNSHSQRHIFQQLKRLRRFLKPSKTPKDGPQNLPPLPEVPSAPENTGRASSHARPVVSLADLPDVEQTEAHRALEDIHGVDTIQVAPPSASTSVLRSHRPLSKFAGSRMWKSLLHPSRGDQPEVTTVYAERAQYRTVAAADPSEPARVPPKSETVPGNYATHAVLPPSPTHSSTEDSDHDSDAPNDTPDNHSPGAFCGLCSRLFPRRSTPLALPDAPGDDNSGIEMAELRKRTEDEQDSATATSTRPATSTANVREGIQREQIERRSPHETAIEVERLRLEAERLRIEAQEKEASDARAHELLILDRQIERARINAGYPAPGPVDPREGQRLFSRSS